MSWIKLKPAKGSIGAIYQAGSQTPPIYDHSKRRFVWVREGDLYWDLASQPKRKGFWDKILGR